MKNGLLKNTVQQIDLVSHFGSCSKEYIEYIEATIPLNKYIEKIIQFAATYEYWIEDKLVGFIAIYTNKGIQFPAYITNVSVQECYASKGIGKKLLNSLIADLKKTGFATILLEVKKNNLIAVNFYKKFGFEFKSDKTEMSDLMELIL